MMLSVFTPTYNRAKLLSRLYRSIVEQGFTDMEWIIVDDGSTDDTAEVVNGFQRENKFPIVYLYKSNGGKHTAFNLALEHARGEYFFCVDSDDWLSKHALTTIIERLQGADQVAGLIAYKSTTDGALLSDEFPKGIERIGLFQLNHLACCNGEFSIVFRTFIISPFRFPVFDGEKYLGENVLYDRLGKGTLFLLLPMAITICEYQPSGLSSMHVRLMRENPAGFCLYFMQRIDLPESVFDRFITAGKYHAFCFFAGKNKTPYTGKYRILVVLAKPLGVAFRYYYKFFRGF